MSKLVLVVALGLGLLAPVGAASAQVVKLKPPSAAPAKKTPAPTPARKAAARPKKKKAATTARRPTVKKLVPDADEPVARAERQDDGGVRVKLTFRDADD